nr:ATPase, T2SS/T4P/T4SS family [Mycobacteroides abscessus]
MLTKARRRLVVVVESEDGMSTVEYAIGTIAAAAFGAILYTVVTGDSIVSALTNIITRALNTGHDGGAGTVHANAPAEVPARLEALGALGGLDRAALHSQFAAAILSVTDARVCMTVTDVTYRVGKDRCSHGYL